MNRNSVVLAVHFLLALGTELAPTWIRLLCREVDGAVWMAGEGATGVFLELLHQEGEEDMEGAPACKVDVALLHHLSIWECSPAKAFHQSL